ncbi:hypothetical protein BS47DRAFT_1399369 [Hydnum rufescens UP504]|uniref:General negative regulator of transcription subunit n=1 Tax=Hydnum rufescens UP504 TaxID=1448309 RepID=A0A9P6AIY5_9AGAM|nr:hypothetical protein BS47DRAFT_1399369 [Hydnum rufescens UP504]
MAARKLQTEIDRTLKKVAEGVELFDSIYDKMQASTNQTQKEKLEVDLKTQIKKLQRLRDQIKTWVSSNEIKDKSQLQMEKFKACEKEMKTKAFSKDGLIAALKLDPKEKEKAETSAWLAAQVDELSRQIEQSEAEVESLQGGPKKRAKGTASSRLEELETLNDRRKWHISRLEIVLRLLENGALPTEKVLELKEDISYFVESNTEEDFEEDEGIYDDLNLDAEEAAFGVVGDEGSEDSDSEQDDSAPSRSPLKDPSKAKSPHREENPAPRREEMSPILRKATTPMRTPNFAAQPMSQALKSGLPPSGAPGTAGSKPALPPIRYAAAVANSSSNGQSLGSASTNGTNSSNAQAPGPPPSTSNSYPSLSTPALSSAASVAAQDAAPPSPSITSSPIASSVAPPSLMSRLTPPPGSSGYFDSRQHSPVLSSNAEAGTSGDCLFTSSGAIPFFVSRVKSVLIDVSSVSLRYLATGLNIRCIGIDSGSQNRSQPQNGSVASQSQPAPRIATQTPVADVSSAGSQAQQAQPHPPTHVAQPSPLPQQVQFVQQQPHGGMPLEVSNVSTRSSPLPPPPQSQQQHPQYPLGASQSQQETRDGSLQQQQHQQVQHQPQPPAPQRPAGLPSSLADLVASFEGAKQKAPTRMSNLNQVHKVLESGFSGIPQPRDTEKELMSGRQAKVLYSRNPYSTPPYYPQQPLASFDSPALYSRFETETLFYIFYYHAGTYQQYLAAAELKRQSWRFHVKYLTWFQRHSEPQAITDEYEQGVYVYFDWEGSWCQRKKSDFRFEYRYLSED